MVRIDPIINNKNIYHILNKLNTAIMPIGGVASERICKTLIKSLYKSNLPRIAYRPLPPCLLRRVLIGSGRVAISFTSYLGRCPDSDLVSIGGPVSSVGLPT